MKSIKILKSVLMLSVLSMSANSLQAQSEPAPQISMGNGSSNWIKVEDVKRDQGVLTFSEVQIDGSGWLVIHPFENGAANGDKYVAATYLEDGLNSDVSINVYKGLETGEMFIVMLHSDSNKNKVLDFVFVDEINVMDLAVLEGSTLIGHAIPAP